MAAKKQYSSIKSKSKKGHYTAIAVIILVLVSLISAFFLISLIHGITYFSDNSHVSAVTSVTGNDLMVEIIDKGGADELTGIGISLSDSTLGKDEEYKEYSSNKIIFKNACLRLSGEKHVFVFGYFKDGSKKTILSTILKI